jgi:hypothetical protein
MVKSRDELIKEFADKYGYNRSDEDEDDDDGGDATAPPAAAPPPAPTPLVAAPYEIIVDEEDLVEMVPEQEPPEAHDVILTDAEPKLPQPRLFNVFVRDYEESRLRMMDNLDDLDDPTEADYNVDEWFLADGSNDQD